MSGASAQLAQQFYSSFQTKLSELTSAFLSVESSPAEGRNAEVIQDYPGRLAGLRKEVTEATPYLPSYDQRSYEKQLKELELRLEALRVDSTPKTKFSFKRKPLAPKASAPIPSPSNSSTMAASSQPVVTTIPQSGHFTPSEVLFRYLTASSFSSTDPDNLEFTLRNLDHNIVNLMPSNGNEPDGAFIEAARSRALHAQDIKNSILLIGSIDGSALIHNLENCVVVISCHQLRIHTSKNTTFYVKTASPPVIEHCSDLSFARYPFPQTNGISLNEPEMTVVDFSHIKHSPSPNWRFLRPEEAVPAEEWAALLPSLSGLGLERIEATRQAKVKQLLQKFLSRHGYGTINI